MRERFAATLVNSKLDEPPIPTLVATIAAYRDDTRWIEALKRYIEGNIQRASEFFAENQMGMKAFQPHTSFLLWIDCRALGLSQDQLMARFKDGAKVILNNGVSYGPGGEGFVRMNLGCPVSTLDEALGRIKREFA